jgi:hypothetical protein
MYSITDYSYAQAKKLGVEIKPSTKKNKKIDVIKDNKIISIGDKRYKDYPNYLKIDKNLAEQRRKLYNIRHKQDMNKKGTAGFYASKILW